MELRKRPGEMNPPLPQEGNMIGDVVGADHVVGDHDRSDVQLGLQAPNQAVDRVGDNRIESGRRLIVEDAGGLRDDGPGQGGALPHASAQIHRHLPLLPLQGDQFEGMGHLVTDHLLIAFPSLPQREGDVLVDGQ